MIAVPDSLQEVIRQALTQHGVDITDSRTLADAILRLSDFYIANPEGQTPWSQSYAVTATLAYYMPLNAIRLQAALQEPRRRGFFEGLNHLVDFGCGPGTATLALQSSGISFRDLTLIDRSSEALRWSEKLLKGPATRAATWVPDRRANPRETLFVASYSLTEAPLPKEALDAEALILLEPSTSEDARRLMARREELIARGFHLWAPCVHADACPLLTHSARDWCHDRAILERPGWLQAVEDKLPFRNQSVTWMALFARKKAPPPLPVNMGRLVGDLLKEKGKNRQMVCRSSAREFLAWMHRDGEAPEFPRGALIEVPPDARKVSNEIRMQKRP